MSRSWKRNKIDDGTRHTCEQRWKILLLYCLKVTELQLQYHILRSYHCGSSICSMLASQEIQLFIVWGERSLLCSNYVLEESIWKTGRMKRDMLAFLTRSIDMPECQNYDIRHWINDEFSPKMIVYPWQRAYLHTAVSRGCFLHLKLCVQGLFWPTTSTGMKWDNIYLLVLLFIDLLQRRPGNSAPVPFGNMENL